MTDYKLSFKILIAPFTLLRYTGNNYKVGDGYDDNAQVTIHTCMYTCMHTHAHTHTHTHTYTEGERELHYCSLYIAPRRVCQEPPKRTLNTMTMAETLRTRLDIFIFFVHPWKTSSRERKRSRSMGGSCFLAPRPCRPPNPMLRSPSTLS